MPQCERKQGPVTFMGGLWSPGQLGLGLELVQSTQAEGRQGQPLFSLSTSSKSGIFPILKAIM